MKTTTAEYISKLLNDDGQNFTAATGTSFKDLTLNAGALADWRDGYQIGEVIRYTFPDGSVILEAGAAWDFGYPDCYCWKGEGHTENCTLNQDEF